MMEVTGQEEILMMAVMRLRDEFCDGKDRRFYDENNRTREGFVMERTGQQRFCDGSNRTKDDSVEEVTGHGMIL